MIGQLLKILELRDGRYLKIGDLYLNLLGTYYSSTFNDYNLLYKKRNKIVNLIEPEKLGSSAHEDSSQH